MKALVVIFSFLFVGCLHKITTRGYESVCAQSGQFYEGFTITGHTEDGDVGHVRCARPQNNYEQCVVEHYQLQQSFDQEFNSKYFGKRFAIGAGYVFYVLPGAYMYYLWSDENEKDYMALNAKNAEGLKKCGELTAH